MGIFVNFHQKLVVYYILDYFGILFILDIMINSNMTLTFFPLSV